MKSGTITERMARALADLDRRWRGRRRPKAFYLNGDDWLAFKATSPPNVTTDWGNNPVQQRTDPAFDGVPVRPSTSTASRLYNNASSGFEI